VYTWLVKELVLRRKAGGIATDAPVVSRIYQVRGGCRGRARVKVSVRVRVRIRV